MWGPGWSSLNQHADGRRRSRLASWTAFPFTRGLADIMRRYVVPMHVYCEANKIKQYQGPSRPSTGEQVMG